MKRLIQAAAVGMLLFAGATAPSATARADETLDKLKASKTVRIGFANEAPFSFQKSDGTVSGADYDVAKAIMTRLGIDKFEGVLVNFSSLLPGLMAKRFDMVAAGLYIRKDRCAQVLFSDPNIVVSDTLVVKKGNPKKLNSYKDIAANKSVKVGGTSGTVTVKNALEGGVAAEQIVEFPDVTSSLSALRAGRTDGALQTTATAGWTVRTAKDDTVEVATPFDAVKTNGSRVQNFAGFVFAKEAPDFRDAFNNELKKFLGTPEHFAILEKYGLVATDVPRDVTLAKLCE
jgi:polar amino acid transport system substrate-binding protein